MYIANPIYDVAFKYMLEDDKVAKTFLSAIVKENILELEFRPQEYTVEVNTLTVCRFDFAAKIETDNGSKIVTIELQKAQLSSDLMRFRRYLGVHYQNPGNAHGTRLEKPRQIYCIYFLDYGRDLPEHPVLEVDYILRDIATGDELNPYGEFVSALHHRSWIVQIRQLKSRRRNDLEKLLSIFDQSSVTEDRHVLNIADDELPKEYRPIARRLRKVLEDDKKKKAMELEDDVINEFRLKERLLEEKDKTIAEKDKTIAEKDKALANKDKVLANKDRNIEDKEREIVELKRLLNKIQK